MKFMKLGSKPDLFQSKDKNTRYVAAELATDIIINIGNVKFYLHKFPLLSKSAHLQKLVAMSNDENTPEVQIHDIPGGPATFEICAKFCYGMTVTLNAYNVASARCAAEYLEMYETIEKGNLAFKIEVFLNSSIFRSWKDSIIVFQTTKSLTPFSEELKVVKRCVDSIVSKVSMDTSRVDWSYSYNRTKLASENGIELPVYNNVRKIIVPKDWWVEDLCDLQVDLFKKIIITIRANKKVSPNVLGESLKAYTQRRLKNGDAVKTRSLIETILCLLPTERNSVSCDFLINLLQESVRFSETRKHELVKRIGEELQNVSVDDLVVLDVDLVREIVKIFLMQDQVADHGDEPGFLEVKFVDSGAKVKVAKLIDCYLAEVAKDRELPVSKFVDLADMVLMLTRSSHDGIYRAIDTFLKEHPGLTKTETKRLCKLMDCRKLSADACMHAVQNERLPLRVVVQVLFFEQIRATVARGSHGSSRSVTTNTEEEWDSVPTSEELAGGKPNGNGQKAKGMVISKRILSKLFSRGDRGDSDDGSSGTSCSTNAEETKSVMPSRSKRH